MPELPDIVVYLEALEQRILGETLERVNITAPFLLRTAVPPIESATGRKVVGLRRVGKRIAIRLEGDLWLVLHLMIAGRLHWKSHAQVSATAVRRAKTLPAKNRLATFEFSAGALSLTERARNGAHRCTWSQAKLDSTVSTRAVSKFSKSIWRLLPRRFSQRTIP